MTFHVLSPGSEAITSPAWVPEARVPHEQPGPGGCAPAGLGGSTQLQRKSVGTVCSELLGLTAFLKAAISLTSCVCFHRTSHCWSTSTIPGTTLRTSRPGPSCSRSGGGRPCSPSSSQAMKGTSGCSWGWGAPSYGSECSHSAGVCVELCTTCAA